MKCCAFVSIQIPDEYLYCLTDNFVYCNGPDYIKIPEIRQLTDYKNYLYIGYYLIGLPASGIYAINILACIIRLFLLLSIYMSKYTKHR